jgi:hypothetical protein
MPTRIPEGDGDHRTDGVDEAAHAGGPVVTRRARPTSPTAPGTRRQNAGSNLTKGGCDLRSRSSASARRRGDQPAEEAAEPGPNRAPPSIEAPNAAAMTSIRRASVIAVGRTASWTSGCPRRAAIRSNSTSRRPSSSRKSEISVASAGSPVGRPGPRSGRGFRDPHTRSVGRRAVWSVRQSSSSFL